MQEQEAWRRMPHEHCHCGARLIEQEFDGTEPLCEDCGYFDAECRCNQRACDSCESTPWEIPDRYLEWRDSVERTEF